MRQLPLCHKNARQRVLPYLHKKDLEGGEVDGDVAVEEPKLGYHASHVLPLSGDLQEAAIGR